MENHLRAFRTLYELRVAMTDATNYKLNKAEFAYDIVGEEFLDQLGAARGAIILTAHMGNYDLGAALFAQKFNRQIQMVRAPEPDAQTASHLNESLEQSGEGAVKIAYKSDGALLSVDLLNTLRQGEIVSIQGDRVIEGVASERAGFLIGQCRSQAGHSPSRRSRRCRFSRSSSCAGDITDIRSLSVSRSSSVGARRRGKRTSARRSPHGAESWRKRSRNTGINGSRLVPIFAP